VRLLEAVLALVGFAMLLKQDTPAAVFPFNQKYVATFLNDEPFVGIVRYHQWERKRLPSLRINTLGGGGYDGCNGFGLSRVVATTDVLFLVVSFRTAMGCDAKIMADAEKFLTALQAARRWRMEGDTLILYGSRDVLRFAPTDNPNNHEDRFVPDAR
jgi:hypothetical protein